MARTDMNSAQKKWKTYRDDKLLHQIYRQLRNRYYREIRSAKEKAWKEFLADARNKDAIPLSSSPNHVKHNGPRHSQMRTMTPSALPSGKKLDCSVE